MSIQFIKNNEHQKYFNQFSNVLLIPNIGSDAKKKLNREEIYWLTFSFIFYSAANGFGIHGSVSWQIMKCDGKALIVRVSKNDNIEESKYQLKPGDIGRRLVLTYYVPFG